MDIFGLDPINKTAALVTSQSGCASDDTLTDEQKRENLVSQSKKLSDQIVRLEKGAERKSLSRKKAEIDLMINAIRPKKKSPGVVHYVMDILREDLSKFEFDRLMTKANERMKADKDNHTT